MTNSAGFVVLSVTRRIHASNLQISTSAVRLYHPVVYLNANFALVRSAPDANLSACGFSASSSLGRFMPFTWPPNDFTLMWLQIAVGFTGALTFVHFLRVLGRKFGAIPELRVYFSPRGGCQDSLVQELQKSRKEILVQAYSFTADPLTYALVDAKKRGIDVQVLLDKSNETERHSDLKILLDQGVQPLVDHDHAIAHNKIVIVDGKVVVTGSYNFTNQAE